MTMGLFSFWACCGHPQIAPRRHAHPGALAQGSFPRAELREELWPDIRLQLFGPLGHRRLGLASEGALRFFFPLDFFKAPKGTVSARVAGGVMAQDQDSPVGGLEGTDPGNGRLRSW